MFEGTEWWHPTPRRRRQTSLKIGGALLDRGFCPDSTPERLGWPDLPDAHCTLEELSEHMSHAVQ